MSKLVGGIAALGLLLGTFVGVRADSAQALGGPKPTGSFGVFCSYSHSLKDDPIMDPGMPGASHLHDFYGNTTTNAFSTPQTLLGGPTTCSDSLDASGYWAPATFLNGVEVTPIRVESWYFSSTGNVQTLPAGLEFIAGDQMAPGLQDIRFVNYSCGQGQNFYTPPSATPYDCTPYVLLGKTDGVVETINFPSCWDGKLSTGDDSMHFAYRTINGGPCPAGFPTTIAQLSVRVRTGIADPLYPSGRVALSLASGAFYTLHSDYMLGWNATELESLVNTCLNTHTYCGKITK